MICHELFLMNSSWTSWGGGGGARVVVSTAAFHARARGSFSGLGDLKETKMFLPHPLVKRSVVGSLRDREVACSASDRQGSNFDSKTTAAQVTCTPGYKMVLSKSPSHSKEWKELHAINVRLVRYWYTTLTLYKRYVIRWNTLLHVTHTLRVS